MESVGRTILETAFERLIEEDEDFSDDDDNLLLETVLETVALRLVDEVKIIFRSTARGPKGILSL